MTSTDTSTTLESEIEFEPAAQSFSTTISPDEFRQLDPDRVRVIDVRTAAEFDAVRLHGSHNIPVDDLAIVAPRLAELDAPVVLVCQVGDRARRAQQILHQAGHQNVAVLGGGLNAWRASAGDVVQTSGRWAMDRQVRGVAGSIVLASILTSIAAPKARFVAGAIGAGLTFSALSNTCAMASVLARLPYNRSPQADVDDAVQRLTS